MKFSCPVTAKLAAFVNDIGLAARPAVLPQTTFLPGLHIDHGAILIDEARLLYPGDILHEAGHLAVVPPEQRQWFCGNAGTDLSSSEGAGDEMSAIAWSYAAAVHLGLDLEIVFHPHGYRGSSEAIIRQFGQGRYIGVPVLQWLGMTADQERAKLLGVEPYPHMLKWVRDGFQPVLPQRAQRTQR